ncbi:MBL fold metallo-hydrolase [Jiangella alkaliphila]|uniref:Ribonuclease BN, tRNA processing enzyme n=1 Tax=Jiangella alkaliphila TaxID=419479 RepID=A0A1H2M7C1_9ACTN|nr:MBL fold metallo-hydrolase [Jiangella alkaliphila]SDU89059.1 Ribonuclease BN, tRNA processing enzyme [Jiangella alkaliphila]
MKVVLHGVRGSTPAPGAAFVRTGGHTSCVSVTVRGEAAPRLVLDAGTGLTNLTTLLGGAPYRGDLVLSHLHWDHVQGLPFFRSGDVDGADVRLWLPAQSGAEPGVAGSAAALLRRAMSPPHFPIGPDGLAGRWRFDACDAGWFEAGGARIRLADLPHKGGRTFGIRVEADGASFAYLPDHAAGAGDGPAADLVRGVDLLLHDAQFSDAERYWAEAYGHSTVGDAVALAARARVGRLVLIHHAPARPDDDVDELAAKHAAAAPLPVAVGREGDVLEP